MARTRVALAEARKRRGRAFGQRPRSLQGRVRRALSLSILPSQCRAARALIDMDQADLARRAVVPRHIIADFEHGSVTPSESNLAAIRTALEAAGVIFVDENDEGHGVRPWKAHRQG